MDVLQQHVVVTVAELLWWAEDSPGCGGNSREEEESAAQWPRRGNSDRSRNNNIAKEDEATLTGDLGLRPPAPNKQSPRGTKSSRMARPSSSSLLLLAALLLLTASSPPASAASGNFKLTVLHVNDIHVRMEETNKYSGSCKDEDRGNLLCLLVLPLLQCTSARNRENCLLQISCLQGC